MRYHPEEIKKANRSCRDRGAIRQNAAVMQVISLLDPKVYNPILDYGAGKAALQAKQLRDLGFRVVAHEFGDNFATGVHSPIALEDTYSVVYASNVLNVQSSFRMLEQTIEELWGCTEVDGGMCIVNYPRQPRYLPSFSDEQMRKQLEAWFDVVEDIGLSYNGGLWRCIAH